MKRRRVLQRSLWGRGLVWLTILNMGGFQCLPAFALPHGEQVTHGEVTFARDGNRLTVTQASGKAIVNFHSFDIGVMESVQFAQPGATAAILNRVVGGASSEIAGSLLANGQVYLINPQGILFSSSARVNVGGLVASAMPMADSDFLAGRLFFAGAGGAVINEGALGGRFIYLIGSQVENRGTITAPEVVMAAGQRSVVIDRAAGGQIRLVIDDEVEVVESDEALADAMQEDESGADVVASTGGEAVETAVEVVAGTAESGAAAADAGAEQTTAETLLEQLGEWLAAAGDAASAEETGLEGVLSASDMDALGSLAAGSVVSDWDAGTVVNEGVVDASGLSGGAITLGGVAVHQDGTLIADGTEGGGGTIRVEGEDYVVATGNSLTTANAGVDGDGGDIRILSPNAAGVDAGALIEARGGSLGGDGGFVEVSGTRYVQMQGRADLRAENGDAGTLLIDPADINISNNPGTGAFLGGDWQTGDNPSELNITVLLDQLQLGNVIVNTSVGNTTELGSGTITVADAIDYASGTTDLLGIGQGNSLDLIADADIVVNGSITGGPGHDLNLNLTAGSNVVVAATIQTGGGGFSSTGIGFDNTGGFIDAGGGAVQIQHTGDVTIGGAVQTTGGAGGIAIEGAAIDLLADLTTDQDAILTATAGAISQGGGTISADGLALRAAAGIGDSAPLQTAVNTLAAANTASGAIHIQNDNAGAALAVGVVDGLSGVSNVGGGITIVNQGALSVDGQVADTGGGDIVLSASGTAVSDDLTVNDHVTASGGDGSILLTAGDSILQNAGDVTAEGVGAITYTASTGTVAGAITMTDGSVSTATGDIQFGAEGDITLHVVGSAGGSVSAVSSTGSVTFLENVMTGGGDLLADAGAALTTAGIDTAGGAIELLAGGALDVTGAVDSGGGAVDGQAGGAITFADTVDTAGGDLALTSSGGDVDMQGAVATSGGSVSATATVGSVSFAADLNSGAGAIDVTAGTDATFNSASGAVTTSNATVTVAAGNNADFQGDLATGGGAISVTASNDVTLAGVDSGGGGLLLNAGVLLTVNGPVSTGGGAVDGQASGAITFADTVETAGGDLALTSSGGDVDMQGAVATSGGSVSATATVGSVTFAADLNSGAGAIDVTAGTDATFNSASGAVTTSNATVTVAAGNNADFQGDLSTGGGAISVTASNDMTLAGVDSGGGGLFLNAGVLLTVNGPVSTGGGAVDGQASGAITFADTVDTAGGDLALTSSGDDVDMQGAVATSGGSVSSTATVGSVSFAADLNSGAGAIDVTAGTDATFNSASGAVTTSNATVTVVAGNNADFQGNLATGGGAISITGANDITLAAVDSGGGDVALESGNTLDLSNDLSAGAGTLSLTSTTGDITQSAGTITAADLVFDSAGTVDLAQAANAVGTVAGVSDGTITLVDGGDLEVGTVNLTSGLASNGNDIDVTAAGSLTLSADVDAGTANLFLTATTGDISQSGGAITADELEVVSGGAATLESTGNAVNVIAGSAGGAFSYVDAGDLTVGATTGQTGLSGDGVAVSAAGDLDVDEVISSSGGDVRLTADSDLSGAGSLTIVEAITTGGGDFVASAYDFENTEFLLNNGTITTDGGDVDITAENSALIRGDILSGGVGTNGTISINAPSLTLRNVDLDTGGAGPPVVIGGGYSTIGFVNLLGDGTIILNQAFPDLVIDGQVIDFGAEGGSLNAARDIILINGGSVVSDPTGSITVHADSDGLINTNFMGAAYGGIYVDDGSSIDSGGALTILGAESLVNPGYAILIEGTLTSVDALLIDGRNPVSGAQPETDVGLDGSAVSTAGGISLLAQRDLMIDGTLETQGAGDIVLDALRDVAVNNDLNSGNDVDITAGGAISSAGGAIAGGTITFAAVDGIGSAANPISVFATALDAVNSGTGEIGLAHDNSADALVTVGSLTTAGDITYTQTGTADLLLATALSSGGGEVSVDAENDLTISAPVSTSGGNLNLDAGVLLTVNGPVSTGGGAMDAAAGGALNFADTVDTAGGDVSLTSTGGDIVAAGAVSTAGGTVTAEADVGAVDFQADLNAGSGGIDVTAGTDATFNSVSGATTTSNAAVTVAAGNNATFQGALATGGGTVDVTAGDAISMAAVDSAGGDLLLDAGVLLTVNGPVSTGGGAIDAAAGGALTLADAVDTAGGDVSLASTGGDITAVGTLATAGGELTADAAVGAVDLQADVNAGSGGIDVTAGTDATFNSLSGGTTTSNAAVTVAAGNNATFQGALDTGGGTVDVTAGDAISMAAVDSAGGDLLLDAGVLLTVNGPVSTGGGLVDLTAVGTIDLLSTLDTGGGDLDSVGAAFSSTGGGITTGGGSVSLNHTGATTLAAGVATAGGDFTARGESLDNTGGVIDTGTGATGTGGTIDIAMNDQAVIGSDLISGDPGIDGGDITVIASNNTTMAAAGGLTVNGNLNSQGGAGGTLTIGGGTTLGGTVSVGAGDIFLNGAGLDLFIAAAQAFDANTGLIALRDIVISESVTTLNGANLTIEADVDGIANTDGMGTAFGGVLVLGAGSVDSSGSLVILGSELLDLAGSPAAVYLASAGNTASAAGNILIRSKAESPAGSGVILSGAVSSSGGSISILSAEDIAHGAAVATLAAGQTIDVESTAGAVYMGAGASASTADGNIRYSAAQDVELGALAAGAANASVTAGGAIRDANAAAINVTAAAARFTAGDAVGNLSLDDRLETQVGTVAAQAGAGGIGLEDADGVVVGSVGPVSVNRVLADGSTQAEADAAALAGLTTSAGGSIVQLGGSGELAVDEAVAADGAGNVLVSSAAGTVALNTTVTSGSGSIEVAADSGLTQAAAGDIQTGGAGTILVLNDNGGIVMADGAQATTAGGDIHYVNAVDGGITLGRLDAGTGRAGISSAGGILDAGDAGGADITASEISLFAAEGIGTGADALETDTATLEAQADLGGIFLQNAGAITVGPLAAQPAANLVSPSGALGGTVLPAAIGGLSTLADGSIVLTAADTITVDGNVNAAGTGNLLLRALGTGNIDLNALASSAGGSVSILAGGNVSMNAAGANLASGGSLDVEAAGGSITMAGGATAATGGGNILMSAVESVTLGGINAGAGSIQVRAGSGSILDGGDTDTDLTAAAVSLIAGNAAGTGADALDVMVGTMAAQAGAGGVFLSATGDADIGSVASFDVDRIGTDGGATDQSSQAVDGLATAPDGAIVAGSDGGELTVDSAVVAGGAGNVLLYASNTGEVRLNQAVQSGTGNITIAADGQLQQSADGDIATTGGDVHVVAAGGPILMDDGATASTAGGNILYDGFAGVFLGGLDAGAGSVHVSSPAGGIFDNGDTDVDVSGSSASFSGTEVGQLASANRIETSVDTIAAAATSGINLGDVDAVTVGSVAAVPVQSVNLDGTASAVNSAAVNGHTTSAGGSIIQWAEDGNLTVDAAVSAGGAGNVLLQAMGSGEVVLNAGVQSGSGHISVASANGIQQNTDIATAGGSIALDAMDGSITMADGASAQTTGASIRYAAIQDVTLGSLNTAGGTIEVMAGGSILDGGDAERDIVADAVQLNAGGSVGTSADKIDTQVATVAGRASSDGIYLDNDSAVAVDEVAAVTVNLTTPDGGSTPSTFVALSDLVTEGGDGNIVLTANDTITIADGANPADGFGVTADGAGNILLMTIGAGDIVLDAGVQSGSGSISILANDSLIQNAGGVVQTAGGSIDMEATTGTLTLDGGLQTGGADIALTGAGDIILTGIDAGAGNVWVNSTAGSILSGAGPTDITAASAGLQAANAVGNLPGGDPIETAVNTIAASAGAGGINLIDADALTVGEFSGATVNRVAMDGTTSPITAGALSGETTTSGGSIVQQAGGTLTVDASVDADGAGNVLLRSSGGDIALNQAAVQSGSGAIHLEGLAVNQQADADIQTGGAGTIWVSALGGGITMADGATATTAGGDIAYRAAGGDIVLGGLNAGAGSVAVVATDGSILDGGDADMDITAAAVYLAAATGPNGIGTPQNALETAVSTLSARAGGGGMYLDNTGAVSINDVSGFAAAVPPFGSQGAGFVFGASDLVTANGGNIILTADDTITVLDGMLTSDGIGVRADGLGNVLLHTTAGDVILGAAAQTGGGNLSVDAAQSIQQGAAGDILTAGGSIDLAAGATVTMADGAVAASGDGNILVRAAGDITVGSLDAGAGSVHVNSTAGSILDGGDVDTDVIASAASFVAVDSVGEVTGANALETEVGTVAAEGGAGGISLIDADGVTVGDVAAVDVNRVLTDGSTDVVSGVAVSGHSTSADGSILQRTQNGTLTIDSAVNAGGVGNVLLQAQGAGSDVVLNQAGIQSGSGDITVLAANAVTQTADGDIATGGGTIDVQALAGDITMADGATAATGGGNIRYTAGGGVTLGGLDAGAGEVAITAAGGSITDGGDADADIAGAAARLISQGGIGTGADHIDAALQTLAANAGQGGIFVDNTGTITVDTVGLVGVNRVQLDGTTAVEQSAATAEDLSTLGGDIVLIADDTITVNAGTAATGGVLAGGAGNVLLLAAGQGDVILNASVGSGTGNLSILAADSVTQGADGDLFTGGAGTIGVEASTGAIMMDDLASASADADILYAAAGDVTLGSLGSSSGGVAVQSSAGSILDGGDSAIDVTALSAVFQAGIGVGDLSAGDALETAVDIVGAEAGAGGINLIDVDEVTVGAAAAVSVNGVTEDGSTVPLAGPAIAGLTTMGNGSIVQRTLDGGLTVDNQVGADGAGNILLQSVNAGPVLLLGAGAQSGSGHITILSAAELMQSADGDLQTGGGDIVATAAFGIFMDQGAASTSGGGNIRYTATGGDAMLASLDAGAGEVAVTADGSILDNGNDAREVIGSAARLQAGFAIGTGTDKLETQVSVLAANAAVGGMFLDNQGAVTVGDVGPVAANQVAADGSLSLVADAGGLSDLATGNGGSIVLVADDTITVADGGQPADGLGVNADGAGNVLLQTLGQGDIVLQSGVRSGIGSISVMSAGGIEQTADGDLTTGGAGTIDVEAMGGSVSMAAGAESATAGGNIRYAGTGNVTVAALDAGNGLLSIDSSGGAIAQSAGSRIVGSAARLSASAGIGAEAAPMLTTVDEVAAVTGSGGVYVTDADALTIGSVGPVAVNRVAMDGSLSPVSDPALTGISANSGDILVTAADGDLTVAAPVFNGTGHVVLTSSGADADLHVLDTVTSGGANVVLQSARDVNLTTDISAERDVAIWADTDSVGTGTINQTAGVAEAVNGHMFLAADDVVQTGATSQFRVPNGTLIVEVTGDLNLGSTLIGGGVQAESFVVGAENIIVDTLITVAETLIFRAEDSIFHSPGNTSGSIVSQSIAMRAGGDIGRAGNQEVDFLRVNSDFLGTFATGNEFIIEADNTESAGPVLLITAGFDYPNSGPEFAELIPRPFEDLLDIEGLFDGIEADEVLNIIVGGDLTGTAIVSGGDAIIRVTGSVMLDEIRIGGTALDIRVGGDFNVGIFEASVLDLLDVAGNGDVGSFTVVNHANIDFGGSFSGESMDVGGPLDMNVGGNWVFDRVELGPATDRIVVGGSAQVGSLQESGSLDLNVGGNYSGGSLSVAGLLDAAINGNIDLGSLNAGTLQAGVRGSGAIDSFNVSGNATANFGGSLTGGSMDIGGVTDLTVGGDWDYNSAVFGGNALVRVTGGANVSDLVANSTLDAVIGGSLVGTSFRVNSDAILDVGGDWMYDTVVVGNALDAVVDGRTQAGDFSAGTMILDSGSAEIDNLDVSRDSTAVIGADMTLGNGTVGGDADWTTGGNLDIVELSVDGSLLASVDGTLSFEQMTAGNVEIDAGAIDLGRLTTGSAQIAAGGSINNNGAFISASTLNMTAGGNIGSNGSISMNVGTIQTISGGGNVDITQLATGDTLVGLLRAGGTLDVGVPNGGLVDNNGEGLNIASGGDSRFSAQYLGTVDDALEVDIGGNLLVDGAGLSGNDMSSQVRVFVNVVGDIAGAGRRIQYIGDVSIPGLIFLNGQLLLGDQFLLLEVARTEAFVVETPEIKSPQGVFGDPYFIHLYMQISEAWNLFLDFILFGEAQVNADPEMPPDAKRTIKIGGTEKPYAR